MEGGNAFTGIGVDVRQGIEGVKNGVKGADDT
jgi:hypothetical protein